MVELPGAVPQPWIVKNPAIPAGRVEKQKIRSELLKNEHNLSVYTPPGYKANGSPYALLVVFDEGSYLDGPVPTPVILDNLIAASKIPATVAVLIANPSQESRNKELPPNPDFADFLAKELVPWIHAHYNVTSDPRLTVVGGSSYGGIAATFAGLRHSGVFGNVLCQSGSFWWAPDHTFDSGTSTETGWLAKEFIKSPKLALKFYMDAGSFEFDSGGNWQHPRTQPAYARRPIGQRIRSSLPAVRGRPRFFKLAGDVRRWAAGIDWKGPRLESVSYSLTRHEVVAANFPIRLGACGKQRSGSEGVKPRLCECSGARDMCSKICALHRSMQIPR